MKKQICTITINVNEEDDTASDIDFKFEPEIDTSKTMECPVLQSAFMLMEAIKEKNTTEKIEIIKK